VLHNSKTFSSRTGDGCYDVAVVGAGPAGCLTVAAAARAGLSVLLLEKKRLPRDKICGGLISSRALALLPPGVLPQSAGSPVTAVRVFSPRGRSHLYRSSEMLGMVVRRAHFDFLLSCYASACGAVLVQESPLVELEIRQPGPAPRQSLYRLQCGGPAPATYHARCVVGADGARSRCARLFGLRRQELLRPAGWGHTRTVESPPAGEVEAETVHFFTLPHLGGLGWAFPGEGYVNRGVGAPLKPSRLKREYRRLFPETTATAGAAAWPLPFTGPLLKPARGNLLLVGDAAGLVDPFSGEGVYNALKSALLAGCALKTAFAEKQAAGPLYQRLFRAHFGRGFFPALAGAALLHARCLLNPAGMPRSIAAIMLNRHWFKRDLGPAILKEHLYREEGVKTWS